MATKMAKKLMIMASHWTPKKSRHWRATRSDNWSQVSSKRSAITVDVICVRPLSVFTLTLMANIAAQRIQREFQEVVKSDEVAKSLIAIELVNNSLLELKGRITGPPDTPYDGGLFHLEIKGELTCVPHVSKCPFNSPRDVPVQPAEGALRDQDLAPEHLFGHWRHLPRHPQGPVGRRHDHQDSLTLATSTARRYLNLSPFKSLTRVYYSGRSRRPAGRGGREAIQREPRDVPPDGASLDIHVRLQ